MADDPSDSQALPPGGLLPPPFMSSRKSWTASTSSPILIDGEAPLRGPPQSQRIGFHSWMNPGSKGPIVSHGNGTANVSTTATKVPVSDVSSLPLLNFLVAAYLISIVLFSVGSNSVVMIVTAKKRPQGRLRSSHLCTLSLALSDTLFALVIHTVMALASLGIIDAEKIFDGQACSYYGLGTMFFGTFTTCIHACISIIRYINVCHPDKVEWVEAKYVCVLILTSGVYALSWAYSPVLEWSHLESYKFMCTVDLIEKSSRNRIFSGVIFICVLLLPFAILIICYALIVVQALRFQTELGQVTSLEEEATKKRRASSRESNLMRSLRKTSNLDDPDDNNDEGIIRRGSARKDSYGNANESNPEFIFDRGSVRRTQRSLRLQAKLIQTSMVVAGTYILAWIPFVTVCIWVIFEHQMHMPNVFRIGTSLLYKSATAYNPIIYFFMSDSFRDDVRSLCGRQRRASAKLTLEEEAQASSSRLVSRPVSIRSLEDPSVMASNKKHRYDDSYLDFGFTSINDKGVVKPLCDLSQNTLR